MGLLMSSMGILEEIETLIEEVNFLQASDGMINLDISKDLMLVILKAAETHFNRLE
jgi:hypothetical protein